MAPGGASAGRRASAGSLRGHLQRRLLVGVLALVALGGTGAWLFVRRHFVAQFDAGLLARASALMPLASLSPDGVEWDYSLPLFPQHAPGSDAEYFQLWFAGGSTLARSASLGATDLPRRTGTGDGPVWFDLALPDGRPGRAVGVRWILRQDEDDNEWHGEDPETLPDPPLMELTLARGRGELDGLLKGVAGGVLAGGAALALAIVAVVSRSVRGALAPLSARASASSASPAPTRCPSAFPATSCPTSCARSCPR